MPVPAEFLVKGKFTTIELRNTRESEALDSNQDILEAVTLLVENIDTALSDPDFAAHRLQMLLHQLKFANEFNQIPLVKGPGEDEAAEAQQPAAPRRRRRFFQSWL